jgi:hypothetical protein
MRGVAIAEAPDVTAFKHFEGALKADGHSLTQVRNFRELCLVTKEGAFEHKAEAGRKQLSSNSELHRKRRGSHRWCSTQVIHERFLDCVFRYHRETEMATNRRGKRRLTCSGRTGHDDKRDHLAGLRARRIGNLNQV